MSAHSRKHRGIDFVDPLAVLALFRLGKNLAVVDLVHLQPKVRWKKKKKKEEGGRRRKKKKEERKRKSDEYAPRFWFLFPRPSFLARLTKYSIQEHVSLGYNSKEA